MKLRQRFRPHHRSHPRGAAVSRTPRWTSRVTRVACGVGAFVLALDLVAVLFPLTRSGRFSSFRIYQSADPGLTQAMLAAHALLIVCLAALAVRGFNPRQQEHR